jgi:peptidoglycan/xylan/chitin deacetylase (PgdA/CDA1 family)
MAETLMGGPVVTIVMYHVVRSTTDGVLGRLKGLDADAFRGQLAFIRRHYSPVGIVDVAEAAAGTRLLPERPIVLTFDDGYASHYGTVYPLLRDAHVPATFFPVTASLLNRTVLDVNKIQCVLAVTDGVDRAVAAIDAAIGREPQRLPAVADFRAKYWTPSRWDPPEVVYVKRMLQHGLPDAVRRPLIDDLFAATVTDDERDFADELYMTVDHAREMRDGGMTIGAHGGRHVRLPTLDRDGQAQEIDEALRVLAAIGADPRRFTYAYANGEQDDVSVALLRERGCIAAMTTQPRLVELRGDSVFALPRLDTNDLPSSPDAPPGEWTRRAYGETAP